MEHPSDAFRTTEGLDRAVAALAARQYGVFSREQLVKLGASRGWIQHRLRRGRWYRSAHGVYVMAGVEITWRSRLMAGCLAWGPRTAISHGAAAALLDIAGFEQPSLEFTTASGRRAGPGAVHRHRLDRIDVTTYERLPVTTPARTLIDVAASVDEATLEVALDDALRRGLFSLKRLQWRLEQLAAKGRPGIKALHELLAQREHGVPKSVFESLLRRLVRAARLPQPVTQSAVRDGGRVIAVVDFAWPEARLAIEADGYQWHSGRRRWESDLERRNRLTLLGWRVIHVTWEQLARDSSRVVARIRRALVEPRGE